MPNIIDSLIVSLSLDPRSFIKGQKEAVDNFKKTKQQLVKGGGEIEGAAKKATESFNNMARAVGGLLALFTAGKGLRDFIADVTVVNAETGRLAKTLDMSAENLSAWEGAAVRVGGSAGATAGSIQNLVGQFQQFYLTGSSTIIPYMNVLGVGMKDANGNMRDMSAVLLDLADRFSKMDPARAAAFGRALGLDQGTINLLIQGRKAVQQMLEDQRRLGVVTKEDADASAALQKAWEGLVQASTSMGRVILTWLSPGLAFVAEKLTDMAVWARQHGPFLKSLFIGLAFAASGLAVAAGGALMALLGISAETLAVAAAVATAAAAIALLYDDWKTWTEGGKSMLGGLWKYVQDWAAYVGDELRLLKALFFGNADDIRAAWKKLVDDLKKFFSDDLVDGIKKAGPAVLDAFKQAFVAAFDWLKGRFNEIWGAVWGHKLFEDAPGGETPPATAPQDNRNWWQRHAPTWLGGRPGPTSEPSGARGTGSPRSEVEAYIRQAAARRGIDPDVAMAVARSEGLNQYVGDSGSSFGPFQLHYAANIPGMRSRGLGNVFTETTGLDARDRGTWRQQIDFALDQAAKGGWSPWHGAARVGISNWAGLNGAHPAGITPYKTYKPEWLSQFSMASGAPNTLNHLATLRALGNTNDNSITNSSSSQVHIGSVTVNSGANDAYGIAKDLKPALQRTLVSTQANYGLQ